MLTKEVLSLTGRGEIHAPECERDLTGTGARRYNIVASMQQFRVCFLRISGPPFSPDGSGRLSQQFAQKLGMEK